jgi:hypothetical protein
MRKEDRRRTAKAGETESRRDPVAVKAEKERLIAELRRELEHVGLSRSEAEAVAARQIGDSATDHPGASPLQHVVAVSGGWLVIRDVPNLDIGLFKERAVAVEAAHAFAAASGGRVVVHDE